MGRCRQQQTSGTASGGRWEAGRLVGWAGNSTARAVLLCSCSVFFPSKDQLLGEGGRGWVGQHCVVHELLCGSA